MISNRPQSHPRRNNPTRFESIKARGKKVNASKPTPRPINPATGNPYTNTGDTKGKPRPPKTPGSGWKKGGGGGGCKAKRSSDGAEGVLTGMGDVLLGIRRGVRSV